MARPKRNSAVLEKVERRLESLLSIDQNLDLGNGRTVAAFSAAIDDLATKLANYNTMLSTVDRMADDIKVAEKPPVLWLSKCCWVLRAAMAKPAKNMKWRAALDAAVAGQPNRHQP